MRIFDSLIFTLFTLILATPALASNYYEYLVPADLLRLQSKASHWSEPEQIDQQNEFTLTRIENHYPKRVVTHTDGRQRLNQVSYEWAVKTMRSINRHPVVSNYQYDKYNNKGVEIGFCFGRATYVHLALLKMGVNKDAIKKVWAVGPMKAGSINWAFHVATIVKGNTPGVWWVVDDYPGEVKSLRDWFSFMKTTSTDNELKVYITDPNKFSVSLGSYNRIQMGLNLSRDNDWYSHYFLDMLNWFKNEGLESVGLKDLRDLGPVAESID